MMCMCFNMKCCELCCTAVYVCVSSIRENTLLLYTGSGAVTKEDFEKLFADTPSITDHNIHSEMTKLEVGLSDPKTDWSKHLILVGVPMCRSCDAM